jgi:hypothetical protein
MLGQIVVCSAFFIRPETSRFLSGRQIVRSHLFRRFVLQLGVSAGLFLASASLTPGQDQRDAPPPTESSPEIRALGDSVRALQAEVQALNSQLRELRADEERDHAENQELRAELQRAGSGVGVTANASSRTPSSRDSSAAYLLPASVTAPQAATPVEAPNPGLTTEQRLASLEDNQQLLDARITEQSQTKVESGSKYRVRLSGIVLLNMFDTQGVVDNLDVPQIAVEPGPLDSSGTFGGSLRQSQIGIEAFGPDVAGARTSANVKFDFFGGFPEVPNGVTTGIVRLRTGTVRFDWANTSIVAGQDQLFFAPLAPTSLSSLAIPALAYSGNLWNWTPQIRVEHRVNFSGGSNLLLQAGILDSLSGEVPASAYQRFPTWGERSGQPAYAARVSWSVPAFGKDLTVGAGGYYGRQYWGWGHSVDGWAGTTDMTVPIGQFFEFTAAFYRGRAVGGLAGAIGQDVLVSGSTINSTTIVKGLDSMGGWAQLKFKPTAKFEINGAFGQDNPFASELRMFPASPSFYGALVSKNWSPFVNFIYQARSDVLFSVEYRRLQTTYLDNNAYSANHVGLSLGYIF